MVTFLFWTATKTNYTSKCSNFQKKLIDTTDNFYLKFKENNVNDMAAQIFWAVFYSSRLQSKIDPTTDFDGAAILPLYFPWFSPIVIHIEKKWHLIKVTHGFYGSITKFTVPGSLCKYSQSPWWNICLHLIVAIISYHLLL